MAYGWIVDEDHIKDESYPEGSYSNAKGLMGPSDITEDVVFNLSLGKGLKFKMLDDDMELYYSGRYYDDDFDSVELKRYNGKACVVNLGEDAFAPLNQFAEPNSGAVRIFYQDPEGNWGEL